MMADLSQLLVHQLDLPYKGRQLEQLLSCVEFARWSDALAIMAS